MPYGLLWRRFSTADLQQEGIEQQSTSIWRLILLTELSVLYNLMKCVRMCQHNSSNNDSALMSATGRLTMCPTTIQRTNIQVCESWNIYKPSLNGNSSRKTAANGLSFCEHFERSFVMLQSGRGARGGVVVKALRYKPAGRGFDSRCFHWNFSVT